jgi:hypothetical protein
VIKSTGASSTCSIIYDNGSQVGIGTTLPGAKTEILTNASDVLKLTNTTGGAGAKSYIDYLTYTGTGVIGRIGALDMGAWNGSLVFEVNNLGTTNSTATTEAMRITNNGNLGIGYTTPPLESKLVLGSVDGANEGGQLQLNSANTTTYTTAYFMDVYQNNLRFLSGTNAGTTTVRYSVDNAGAFTVNNLAGTGTRNVMANANGTLVISPSNYIVAQLWGGIDVGDVGGTMIAANASGVIASGTSNQSGGSDASYHVTLNTSVASYTPTVTVVIKNPGTLTSSGGGSGQWNNDNDVFVTVGNIAPNGFDVFFREVASNTQNLRIEVVLNVKNF